jgi:hypothetical protein
MKPADLMENSPAAVKSPARLNAGRQLVLSFFEPSPAGEHFAQAGEEERGAVFTRREVADFILDLAGYTADRPLHRFRLLEPAFGRGDFLLPVVERLLAAYGAQVPDRSHIVEDLSDAVRAVEAHRDSIDKARAKLRQAFRTHGVSDEDTRRLLAAWIVEGDFLLADLPEPFTHVVGNPPYVRQELVPDGLMAEYRARYRTIYDRADLYVPFIERGLTSLAKGGTLAFICADRWMKNKYGGPLRAMVAEGYHLAGYVDMTDTPAFHSEVSAYPAITVIRREKAGPTRIAHRPPIAREALAELARAMRAEPHPEQGGAVEVAGVVQGSEPWLLQSFDQLAVVRRLEAEFPLLEEAGCKVGIGVATGADRVFIGPFHGLDVEPDRKLPLATTRDIEDGTVRWTGQGVVNPFLSDGSLVDLKNYPKLARYLEAHGNAIRRRNCAKRNPGGWYRTIDRIHAELTYRPKLLVPDIKGEAHVVYEEGRLYPHHNLYFITSDDWDLKALQAVLLSGIAKLFVSAYSTRMRGGYLRFQAQYLRRIRLPRWSEVPAAVRKALAEAAEAGDAEACSRASFELYRLTPEERAALGGNGH